MKTKNKTKNLTNIIDKTEIKIETRGKMVVRRKKGDGKGLLDYYDVHSSKIYQIRVK